MNGLAKEVHDTMAAINRAWRENRPSEMSPYLHADVTMVFPGFSGTVAGRDALVASYTEFCSKARVLEYSESDEQIQVIGNVAFLNFRFDMLYERASYRERSTGRDLWAFERTGEKWIAVWRTMFDLKEERDSRASDARR
jgi:hypothetical protein